VNLTNLTLIVCGKIETKAEERMAVFKGHPSKTPEEAARGSLIYELITGPRDAARAALARAGDQTS